ncbi:MAG: hypothetical protein VYD87_08460 [Pseudomonadota bacterium]|nr:hypothetical protein [Pseudomonadota bacterium]MEE3102085.1 hypothetical protein [Pseudomonadota bacterium]
MKGGMIAATLVAATGAAICAAGSAQALPVTSMVVMKVADSGPGTFDPYLDWIGAGGFNEGVAGAASLTNNGLDYKDSWVDSNWGDVLQVRVSMYTGGVEQAYMLFDASGTTKSDFFSVGNVIGSSWSDAAAGGSGSTGDFFSIAGDSSINRHWFVNNNYGGCGADVGHMVVLDGSTGACSWESSVVGAGIADRAFIYSGVSTETNWTSGSPAVADVFAVQVMVEDTGSSTVPVPAAGGLIAAALGALGVAARGRRRRAA